MSSLYTRKLLIQRRKIWKAYVRRLDKFWKNQDMVYDYKSDLTGIGNRSLINMDESLTEYT